MFFLNEVSPNAQQLSGLLHKTLFYCHYSTTTPEVCSVHLLFVSGLGLLSGLHLSCPTTVFLVPGWPMPSQLIR